MAAVASLINVANRGLLEHERGYGMVIIPPFESGNLSPIEAVIIKTRLLNVVRMLWSCPSVHPNFTLSLIPYLCMYVVFIFTKSFLIGHITFQGTFGNLSFLWKTKTAVTLTFVILILYPKVMRCIQWLINVFPLPHVFSKRNQGLINNSVILYLLQVKVSFVISCLFLTFRCIFEWKQTW